MQIIHLAFMRTGAVNSLVWIVGFSGQTVVLLDEIKGVVHETALTALIFATCNNAKRIIRLQERAVNSLVWIVGFSGEAVVLLDEIKGVVHETALTALIFATCVTVYQLLFR
ncbi:hypothetical protein RJ640_000561 [Escallonia rubra]|uniref:Uncharacterized protein n=1 Tax=Escallonia rubra TaxID=112253 RepID=A0AA88RQ02_9ASTE|nr:hypothetical protein RJ640_000561 [Escallonia rubra]